jgi:hypothetical protein
LIRSLSNHVNLYLSIERATDVGQFCGWYVRGFNPFRNLNGQMIANVSTPRPGVTEPREVTRVFKLISAP